MANRKSSNRRERGNSPDPYLRTFLRQAVAIIAAERGLNELSHPKLQAMAQQLGLSDSAYRIALEKLKQQNPTTGLNRYEMKFVEMLSSELEKIAGDVLTIRAENKVIDLAEKKYQISAIRAHQLIQETAERFDVGTISHHDAEVFATSLIDDAVGNQLWLRDEEKRRLQHACKKWGLAKHEVEHAIRARFRRNRRRRNKNSLSTLVAILGIVIFLAAVLYGARQIDWKTYFVNVEKSPAENLDSELPTAASRLPDWMDAGLLKKLKKATASDTRLEQLASPEQWKLENRRSTYLGLVELALQYPKPNQPLNRLIGELYFLEPDSKIAMGLLEQIKQSVSTLDQDQVVSADQLRKALSASHLASVIFLANDANEWDSHRRAELLPGFDSKSSEKSETPVSQQDVIERSKQRLVEKCWRNILRNWGNDSRSVIALLPELEKQSAANANPAVNEMRTSLAMQLLDQQGGAWRQIRRSIKNSISRSDTSTANRWIGELDRIQERALSVFVASELASRLDLNANLPHDLLVAELKKRQSLKRLNAFSAEIVASSVVDDSVQLIHEGLAASGFNQENNILEIPASEIPALVLQSIATNNVALAWIHSAADRDFSTFHSLVTRAKDLATMSARQVSAIRSPPTAFERRRLAESLARISNSASKQTSVRVSAIQAIVKVAPKFEDIAYADAVVLARFIFEPEGQRETLEVERAIPNFSKWPNLKLAIADQFSTSADISTETFLSHLERLGFRLDATRLDRTQLQSKILTLVASEINQRHWHSITMNRWIEAEYKILSLTKQRAKILGSDFAIEDQGEITAVLGGIEQAAVHFQKDNLSLLRSIEVVAAVADSDLERTVLANRVLTQVFEDSERVNSDQSESLAALLNSEDRLTHGQRVLISELILMDGLNHYRQNWLERIAKQ